MKSGIERSFPSDYIGVLSKKFKHLVPIERQIVSHLAAVIDKKLIPAGTKLPSIRSLAKLWGTNYFTVHSALNTLVGKGYIVFRTSGSFIAQPRRELRRLCLYNNHRVEFHSTSIFYLVLNLIISNRLFERGVAVIPFYDSRLHSELHTIPPALKKMAVDGEIDGVIATEIFPTQSGWLSKLELPIASLMLEQPSRKIEVDVADLAAHVIHLAVQSKRKTIGLIHAPINEQVKGRKEDVLRVELEKLGASKGISIVCPPRLEEGREFDADQFAAFYCEELLSAKDSPDMLFVYPDSFIYGVAAVLNKREIRVPEQILVVSHRNAEIQVFAPFPMIWLTVKVEDFAKCLIEQIDGQISGEEQISKPIPVRVEQTIWQPVR